MYLGTDKCCGWKRYMYVEEATKVSKNSPHNSQPTYPMTELQNYITRTQLHTNLNAYMIRNLCLIWR